MKKLLMMVLFLLLAQNLRAQDYEDVLLMKDGGITRGIILERIPGKPIKIQVGFKKILLIPLEEIEKISRERVESNGSPYSPEGIVQKGYCSQLDIGFERGPSQSGLDRLHVSLMNGYRFNPIFALGGGLGLRYYSTARDLVIPVFASLKFNFLNRRVSPFLMVSGGYSFDSSNEDEKVRFEGIGYMLNPAAGVNIIVKNKSYIGLGIGYEWQQFNLSAASSSYFSPLVNRSGNTLTKAGSFFLSFGF